MLRQSGFTLIESLTAGLISTIVAGALLTMLTVTNREIKAGTTHLLVGQMQSVVSDQFHISAHRACGVRTAGEPLDGSYFTDAARYDIPVGDTNEIIFCDKNGSRLTSYRINRAFNYLEEWDVGSHAYIPFKVGEDTVLINGANSAFRLLSPRRRRLTVNLAIRNSDESFTFPTLIDTILCRNTSL
jgi:type II secretory pathway pseudopilin PulG